jgi:zinc transport system substrate-binding protein
LIWNFVLQHMKDVKKKIWRRRGPAVLVLCLAVIVQGCAGYPADKDGGHREQNKTNENGRLSVVTTIFPPYDFVREIAGDCVDLKMLLKPGEESHSYEPTPQDMIAIENSDVFIYVGGENDVWVEDILSSMPDKDRVSIRLLDCVETEEEEHVEGMKEPAGDSHHEMHGEEKHEGSVHEIDEHVWTSPVNASVIVEKIKEVLIQKDSENKAAYEENADNFTCRCFSKKLHIRRNTHKKPVLVSDSPVFIGTYDCSHTPHTPFSTQTAIGIFLICGCVS